jgi:septal ring factor EnvC (AmiA/AmiB activator)
MDKDVKRIIVAAALAAAAFNAAAPAKRATDVASGQEISANPGAPSVPETLAVRPSRIRIERCGGPSRAHGKIEAPLFGD